MSLVESDPFRDAGSNISSNLDEVPPKFPGSINSPKIDVYQTKKDVIIRAEVPGMTREDLDVYIDENSVRLSGHIKESEKLQAKQTYKLTRYSGNFSRNILLPVVVRSDHARAEYRNEIVSITAPKASLPESAVNKTDI